MKKLILIAILATTIWGADFSGYTTEKLIEMRGTVAVEQRDAFRAEMKKRIKTMTPEQKELFMQSKQKRSGMGQGHGMGMQNY